MKKIALLSTILILFGLSKIIGGDHKEVIEGDFCNNELLSYQTGEYLKYKVYYNWSAVWVNAGNATFEIAEDEIAGKPVHHMVCIGKTAKAFNWFFKVYDQYETYMDQTTAQPLRFVRSVEEGNYRKYNEYTFKPENDEVFINYITRMGKVERQDETIEVPACTQDMLSSVYYTRNVDYSSMDAGDRIEVSLLVDGEIYDAYLEYMGKDELKTKHGKFRCAKFTPSLIEGEVFEGDEKMVIWVTDDDNRLPLLIESPLSVGWAKAYLEEFDGLKYSMEALID